MNASIRLEPNWRISIELRSDFSLAWCKFMMIHAVNTPENIHLCAAYWMAILLDHQLSKMCWKSESFSSAAPSNAFKMNYQFSSAKFSNLCQNFDMNPYSPGSILMYSFQCKINRILSLFIDSFDWCLVDKYFNKLCHGSVDWMSVVPSCGNSFASSSSFPWRIHTTHQKRAPHGICICKYL